jgi:hypothetical protein
MPDLIIGILDPQRDLPVDLAIVLPTANDVLYRLPDID